MKISVHIDQVDDGMQQKTVPHLPLSKLQTRVTNPIRYGSYDTVYHSKYPSSATSWPLTKCSAVTLVWIFGRDKLTLLNLNYKAKSRV